jgi:protein-tyrosine-phosphatase
MPVKRSVLFVCSAKQGRSPKAMGRFAALVKKKHHPDKWRIESAGCWAMAGMPATSNAAEAVRKLGLNLDDHRAQPVTDWLLKQFQLVLCMEMEHKTTLRRNYPEHAGKIYLLSEMSSHLQEIDDPVGQSIERYSSTIGKISQFLDAGYPRICELTNQ